MKTDELILTAAELEELCRLYMDCKLSVLEEKELEYILSRTEITSPAITDARSLMEVNIPKQSKVHSGPKHNWNWRLFSSIAASIAVAVSAVFYFTSPQDSLRNPDRPTYIAAYRNGLRLNDQDAALATDIAIAKADSLMNYASLAEHANMQKADEIISETFKN